MSAAVQALRELAMPVVVVAARDDAGPCGATATAMYTSLDPVELVVSLTVSSRTARAALASRELSVSLLGGDQEEIAARIGQHSSAADKFADLGIETSSVDGFEAPALASTTAFWGRLVHTVPSGDHVLILVRVEHVHLASQDATAAGALIRLGRAYTPVIARPAEGTQTYPL